MAIRWWSFGGLLERTIILMEMVGSKFASTRLSKQNNQGGWPSITASGLLPMANLRGVIGKSA